MWLKDSRKQSFVSIIATFKGQNDSGFKERLTTSCGAQMSMRCEVSM